MEGEIQIYSPSDRYETRSFTFSGGELQVQIPDLPNCFAGDITVLARLQSSDALVRLLLATEILYRAHRSAWRRLVVPYFPYARQDRVMQPGEVFSLKVAARIINALTFDEVVVCDSHSDVACFSGTDIGVYDDGRESSGAGRIYKALLPHDGEG